MRSNHSPHFAAAPFIPAPRRDDSRSAEESLLELFDAIDQARLELAAEWESRFGAEGADPE
ncbi:hypothetical protein [Streptomyces boninensis]|uniref:hypothetical protein n=1 Tax=Streptomyces boninensis TaxID=2039455 RepID=UPI003B21E244